MAPGDDRAAPSQIAASIDRDNAGGHGALANGEIRSGKTSHAAGRRRSAHFTLAPGAIERRGAPVAVQAAASRSPPASSGAGKRRESCERPPCDAPGESWWSSFQAREWRSFSEAQVVAFTAEQ